MPNILFLFRLKSHIIFQNPVTIITLKKIILSREPPIWRLVSIFSIGPYDWILSTRNGRSTLKIISVKIFIFCDITACSQQIFQRNMTPPSSVSKKSQSRNLGDAGSKESRKIELFISLLWEPQWLRYPTRLSIYDTWSRIS